MGIFGAQLLFVISVELLKQSLRADEMRLLIILSLEELQSNGPCLVTSDELNDECVGLIFLGPGSSRLNLAVVEEH